MAESEPTALYQYLVQRLPRHELLPLFRNPPYQREYQAPLAAYLTEIKRFQGLVRGKVNLKFELTETDGAIEEHLFETEYGAVYNEFENWGLSPHGRQAISCMNTGHFYVTVESAQFESRFRSQGPSLLKQIKSGRDNLAELVKPIEDLTRTVYEYSHQLLRFCAVRFGPECDYPEEQRKLGEFKKKFFLDTDYVRKGILSLALVQGIVYHLEESIDLSRHHPGD